MRLEAGTRVLDRYAVDAFLGEGGMGQVYRGRHLGLGYPVAVKVLTDRTDEQQGRFEREARLMARVRHPNVVAVLDFGLLAPGLPCIVMEHVDGESLEARLARRGPLPWPEAAAVTLGILAGLEAIHAAAILHRDLKPANVLVAAGPPEVVKVIDFGIGRPEGTDVTRYTRTGAVVGTPAYMAPERLMNKTVDGRSDLYAVGLILHEMLAGDLPYGGRTIESVLRRAVTPAVTPAFPPHLPAPPPGLVSLVMAAVSIDPRSRPDTPQDFARALREGVTRTSPHAGPAPARPVAAPPSPADLLGGPTVVTATPVPGPDARHLVVAARLPASRLASAEDRRFLAGLAGPRARAFTLGSSLWFAVVPLVGDADEGRATAESVRAGLASRYASLARVEWGLAEGDVPVTAAALSGAAPLPPEVQSLVQRLAIDP